MCPYYLDKFKENLGNREKKKHSITKNILK
jgi:hypothetical protein